MKSSILRSLTVKRLTLGSLFTLLFIGSASWLVPLCLIDGVVGLFGGDMIKTNGVYLHGWQSLISGIIGGPIAAFFLSVFATLFYFPGLWIFSFFRPVSITYLEANTAEQGAAANP
jgi:hypothetical protein